MTRQEYIEAVKAKLDEISPFGEPDSFIAASGDSDYDKVKPVVSYIDSELDHAAQYCLNSLPLSLLGNDIQAETMEMRVTDNNVGIIEEVYDYMRLCRLHTGDWMRDVTAFISTSSPLYLLQQNKYTRGGVAKPVVAYNPEEKTLECFSMPAGKYGTPETIRTLNGRRLTRASSHDAANMYAWTNGDTGSYVYTLSATPNDGASVYNYTAATMVSKGAASVVVKFDGEELMRVPAFDRTFNEHNIYAWSDEGGENVYYTDSASPKNNDAIYSYSAEALHAEGRVVVIVTFGGSTWSRLSSQDTTYGTSSIYAWTNGNNLVYFSYQESLANGNQLYVHTHSSVIENGRMSVREVTDTTTGVLYYIETRDVAAEDVESGIEDYIVLMCAAFVLDIIGDANASKLMREKVAEKLQAILN